jgi:sortase A
MMRSSQTRLDPLRMLRRFGVAALALPAALLMLDAGWIHAKAALAQHLLAHAWNASASDGQARSPWPGADTHPVARLQVARLGIDQIVVAGDSGRSIAFGPGWAQASALPGRPGTTVLSGHRDTHFAWLSQLRPGDLLSVEGIDGQRQYQVASLSVADVRHHRLHIDADQDRLLLVTCWPFDAVRSGGPERYVVTLLGCAEDADCDDPPHSAQAAGVHAGLPAEAPGAALAGAGG